MGQQTAFGLSSLYDPSIAADEQELMRRQQIADMLRRQSFAPIGGTQMAGNVAIRNSPLEGIAKVFSAYMANKTDQDTLAKRNELSEKQSRAMLASVDNLFGNGGQPSGVPTPQSIRPEGVTRDAMQAGGFPQPQDAAPAPVNNQAEDVKRRAKAALLMGNKDLANKLLANLWEQTPEMKNMAAKGIDPKALGQAEMDKLRADARRNVSAGDTVLGADGQPIYTAPEKVPTGYKRDAHGNLTVDPNWLQAEMALRTAGANRMMTNVNAYTPASEVAQGELMKSTRTTYDALKQAPVALESIEKAKALIPAAKGFMGPGGEGLMEAAKFLNNRLGMKIDTEGIKNAEELRTRIFFNVMDNLKKMDAQPSEMQQRMMLDALGKLGTDPGALPQVLDAFGDTIRGKVQLHNQEVAGAVQRGVKFPYDPTISLQKSQGQASTPAAKTVVRTGTQNGRKVVQYSDGTVDYAP